MCPHVGRVASPAGMSRLGLLDDHNCIMYSTVRRQRAVGNDLSVPTSARPTCWHSNLPRAPPPSASSTRRFGDVELPFVDEHRVLIAASAEAVWRALTTLLARRQRGAEALTYVLGAEPRRASKGPLAEGSTVAGFEVAEAVPGRLLRLIGRHRFSTYELTYALDPQPAGIMLSARTRAAFPGPPGTLYRGLVIGTGAHHVLLRRQLRAVRRLAAVATDGQNQHDRG